MRWLGARKLMSKVLVVHRQKILTRFASHALCQLSVAAEITAGRSRRGNESLPGHVSGRIEITNAN